MSLETAINGDDGTFTVTITDNDNNAVYQPMEIKEDGIYEFDQKLSDIYQEKNNKLQSFIDSNFNFPFPNNLSIEGKRAIVVFPNTSVLRINFNADFSGVIASGEWSFDEKIKEQGSFLEDKYVLKTEFDQLKQDFEALQLQVNNQP